MIVLNNETEAKKLFTQEGTHHVGFHLLYPYKWLGSSGHNGSMKDPPHTILTDVKLVGRWLSTAIVSLVTQERLWSTIPFTIKVSSPRHVEGGCLGFFSESRAPLGCLF